MDSLSDADFALLGLILLAAIVFGLSFIRAKQATSDKPATSVASSGQVVRWSVLRIAYLMWALVGVLMALVAWIQGYDSATACVIGLLGGAGAAVAAMFLVPRNSSISPPDIKR